MGGEQKVEGEEREERKISPSHSCKNALLEQDGCVSGGINDVPFWDSIPHHRMETCLRGPLNYNQGGILQLCDMACDHTGVSA